MLMALHIIALDFPFSNSFLAFIVNLKKDEIIEPDLADKQRLACVSRLKYDNNDLIFALKEDFNARTAKQMLFANIKLCHFNI